MHAMAWPCNFELSLCTDAELPDEEDHYDYDYDYEYDEAEHCPDHDQMVLICGGRNCIREPSPHEDCLQCIDNCNGQ